MGERPQTGEEDSSKFELRAPDLSWISQAQLDAMDEDYDEGYPHLAPAFMVEIISSSKHSHPSNARWICG